jgi:maltose alpha-D-glucosyltransferase/alpha-amylase
MLLAEANQWPDDAAAYFGNGDECHMAFHFPLMPRLFMAQRREDSFPIVDILKQTPSLEETCQWALFLRNHDELTLEMVTDEERDYMYRSFAHDPQMRINLGIRRRLAPLLGNARRRMELMNALLFSLPGTPILYYGDEIGMGDNIYLGDRNGVRTPMQWNPDRNGGFSKANPQRLYLPIIIDPEYHYEAVNVETQQNNPHSLLWWMKRLIALRKQSRPLSRGSVEFLTPENRRVLAFLRNYEGESTLVVANLSRFAQPVELELGRFQGLAPVEMFGRVPFPPIKDYGYCLTLAPHSFYWFALERTQPLRIYGAWDGSSLPVLSVESSDAPFAKATLAQLGGVLPAYLMTRSWFPSKARVIRSVELLDTIELAPAVAGMLLLRVQYSQGEADLYALWLAAVQSDSPDHRALEDSGESIARFQSADGRGGLFYNAVSDPDFCRRLIDALVEKKRFKGSAGDLVPVASRGIRVLASDAPPPRLAGPERTNAVVVYGDALVLKLYRRLEPGFNPEIEIGRYLTEDAPYPHVARTGGWLEYRGKSGEPISLGIVQSFVPNSGDGWEHTIDALSRFFERALAHSAPGLAAFSTRDILRAAREPEPQAAHDLLHNYLEDTRILGQRTAELHLALAARAKDPNFAPEPFSTAYQQALYHGIMSLANETLQRLREKLTALPEDVAALGSLVLERQSQIPLSLSPIRTQKFTGMRIRCHGDYQLGELLWTGNDYAIVDFEGEPSRPMNERRIKRSPLRDVACMVRSFHYASSSALLGHISGVMLRPDLLPVIRNWANWWYLWVSAAFLKQYFASAGGSPIIPESEEEIAVLLDALLLEKALYEVAYELRNRPAWAAIPLQAVLHALTTR